TPSVHVRHRRGHSSPARGPPRRAPMHVVHSWAPLSMWSTPRIPSTHVEHFSDPSVHVPHIWDPFLPLDHTRPPLPSLPRAGAPRPWRWTLPGAPPLGLGTPPGPPPRLGGAGGGGGTGAPTAGPRYSRSSRAQTPPPSTFTGNFATGS